MPGNDSVTKILGEIDSVQKNIENLKGLSIEQHTKDKSIYGRPLSTKRNYLMNSLEKLLESIETYETYEKNEKRSTKSALKPILK